ncbi:methylated-DNA-[protein]-cysteine S-methyltransferase [Luteococcus japonicus]|uniref:Methylated-DNA--protein-cysteine methyltransferase n=1 Tax=Luteococcus japonicus TaxID=33984 RepID=A0A3N1ZTJ9_9ACTN|nr:methylated-DNA--[protein]-cysteine S-methyltransferase [Luteococcus japonicus]ROR54190.1 methylated-DNA-[protein]-cysteine S-methyltransferase [Luteococcus japonicus]
MTTVAHCTVQSPVGSLLLAATDQGLVRVAFEMEGFDVVLAELAARVGNSVAADDPMLAAAAAQLDEYFAGTRTGFDLPLDHALSSGFRLQVQQALPGIEYGTTLTYKELAELIGRPTAVRAVGTACSTNPLPVVLPCHRVLRRDGSLGGYLGGLDAKRALLELEGALG